MFSNLSIQLNEETIHYPILDSELPFSEYIARSRSLIKSRRPDLQQANNNIHTKQIIDANSPYELNPDDPIRTGNRLKYCALLIHGLFDCPFSLRDIGSYLQRNGIFSRAILLPGHGTMPSDLLSVSYHDWIQAVRYGVETLRKEVEQIFLIGYSTGAALSLYHALQDTQISGLILLAPAIKIKVPIDIIFNWHRLTRLFSKHKEWLYLEDEFDYAKYRSIAFHPVNQVSDLTSIVEALQQRHSLTHPIFMVTSREDETISSHMAIDFFSNLSNQNSRLLLYTSCEHTYPDQRIHPRITHYPDLNIKHLSHVSLLFDPNNFHYGKQGDYSYASHPNTDEFIYGAYNRIEVKLYELLHKLGLIRKRRRELTYNPDFDFMAKEITKFIFSFPSLSNNKTA